MELHVFHMNNLSALNGGLFPFANPEVHPNIITEFIDDFYRLMQGDLRLQQRV